MLGPDQKEPRKRKRASEILFLVAILASIAGMNGHYFVPESMDVVEYDANADRFFHLMQSLTIALLIATISSTTAGRLKVFANSCFGFGIANVIDELLFQNAGSFALEVSIFIIIMMYNIAKTTTTNSKT